MIANIIAILQAKLIVLAWQGWNRHLTNTKIGHIEVLVCVTEETCVYLYGDYYKNY